MNNKDHEEMALLISRLKFALRLLDEMSWRTPRRYLDQVEEIFSSTGEIDIEDADLLEIMDEVANLVVGLLATVEAVEATQDPVANSAGLVA